MILQKLKILGRTFVGSLLVTALFVAYSSLSPASAVPAPVDGANSAVDCGRDNGTLTGPANPNCVTQPVDTMPTTEPDLVKAYINPLIKLLSVLVGITVVIGVIYGGIEYSTWDGDPKKVANGKRHIRNAAIALVAYVLALALLNFLIPGGVSVINI